MPPDRGAAAHMGPFGTVSVCSAPSTMPCRSGANDAGGAMQDRVNWIDWLKVIVVFGVFLYHAAQPFVLTSWLVTSPQQSVLLSALAGAGYLFGMPLMFLLAGSATWLALGRRGTAGFVGLRVRRILVPLLLGLALLSPAQAWVAYGAGTAPVAFWADYWGAATLPLNPQWLGDYGYHLWFLGFLFAYSLMALPLIGWLQRRPERARELTGRLADGRGLALLAVTIVAVQLGLRPVAPAYRDWADAALWFCYFVAGIAAAADPRLVASVMRWRWAALALVALAALAYVPVALGGGVLDLEHAPGYGPGGLAYVALRTVAGFGMVLVFVGFAARYLTARPRGLGWASRAVLPFYVIHHPVVVVVAAWAVQFPLGLWTTFAIICAISLVLTLAVYQAGLLLASMLRRGHRGRDRQPPALAAPGVRP